MVEGHDENGRRELHVGVRLAREPREERDRLQPAQALVEEVLPDADVREAVPLRRLDLAEHVVEVRGGVDGDGGTSPRMIPNSRSFIWYLRDDAECEEGVEPISVDRDLARGGRVCAGPARGAGGGSRPACA